MISWSRFSVDHFFFAWLKEKQGMSEDEAFEVAMNRILAPPDGPAIMEEPGPKPLNPAERKAVYQHLERLGDEEEKE
jgi:hypothetical protein